MNTSFSVSNIFSWVLLLLFVVVGILNIIKVDTVTGSFYLVYSLIFCPPLDEVMHKRVGFSIPYFVKVILALFVIWGSLAAGDLAEIYGL